MHPRPSAVVIGTIATVLVGFSAVATNTSAAAKPRGRTVTVDMKAFAFAPTTVSVRVGDTVQWTYGETATTLPAGCESPEFRLPVASCPGHSVTATTMNSRHRPLFDSGVHRATGFPFRVTFTRAGTFSYFCDVHGGAHPNNPVTAMNGTVSVSR
jgi:plastocyanin